MNAARQPRSNEPTTAEFLATMFARARLGSWVNTFSINRADGSRRVDWSLVDDLDALAARALDLGDADVWFSMAAHAQPLGQRRGSATDCLGITSLWVDIDVISPGHASLDLPPTMMDAAKLLASMPVPPTAVINTGNGLQGQWSLTQMIERERAAEFLAQWGATWDALGKRRGWHVDNVFDITRVMRLPGTYNRKNEPAHLVTVTHWHPERVYSLAEFAQHLIAAPTIERAEQRLRLVPYIGTERPSDRYNAEASRDELLERHGFVFDRTVGDERHYRAPHHADERGMTGATAYADGHVTIWSETFARDHGLDTRRPYDAFGLLARLEYGGDFTAAAAALAGHESPSVPISGEQEAAGADDDCLSMLLDWVDLFDNVDDDDDQWIAEPVIARGRAHALFAPGGTGKSLLSLWLAVQIAIGGVGLDGQRLVRRRVLYLDYEMTREDLVERLGSMGYGRDTDLSWLGYALLPPLPPADTAEGGTAIAKLARRFDAEVVFIDTFARAVAGDENEADTIRNWYRWTGLHLKAEGRAFVRTDHAGKDPTKGQRGSSAKNDDVDIVWQMLKTDDGFRLKALKRRGSWVPEEVVIALHETAELTFSTAAQSVPAGTAALVKVLADLGVPLDAGRPACRAALHAAGQTAGTEVLAAAVKTRKLSARVHGQLKLPAIAQGPRSGRTAPETSTSDGPDSSMDSSGQNPVGKVDTSVTEGTDGSSRNLNDPVVLLDGTTYEDIM